MKKITFALNYRVLSLNENQASPKRINLKQEYKRWYSPTLGRDFEMLVYGHYGHPVLVFPTTMGRFFESRDFKLVDSVAHLLDEGRIKLYCLDSIDRDSWYNKSIHPADRVRNHLVYDKFVDTEVVDGIRHEYGLNKVSVAGASFGGFHALNFAFRHPDKIHHAISMSGSFDIRSFLNGHYDDNVYFTNPVDYLPQNQNPELWNLNIVLGYGEWDICRDANITLSGILSSKNIPHWRDEKRWAEHDWPLWRMMFPEYLNQI